MVTVVLSNEDALQLKAEFDQQAVDSSHIEGFRKGKAPIQVVSAKIGRDKYYNDMREYIASKALEEALKKEDISPVIKPKYEFADWEEGGKFVFTATIYTQPENPTDKIIKPDIDVAYSREHFSRPMHGIPGQMPIIDGKLPPHLSGTHPLPESPNIPQPVPSSTNMPEGDPGAPIHRIPKRPDELLQIPSQEGKGNKDIKDIKSPKNSEP